MRRGLPATSHFVVVDTVGNIACMTSSIGIAFGSHLVTRQFVLNNQLTDFSFARGGDRSGQDAMRRRVISWPGWLP
ncbi:MAG: gamma-glutamyltransferase [Myxococcota bacterium]